MGDKPPWPLDYEKQLWGDICQKSFWWFLLAAFGGQFYMDTHPEDRWIVERVHKPLADWLQAKADDWQSRRRLGVKKRTKLAIVIPRGFGKTVIVTKAFALWNHLRNPDLSTFIGSETLNKAADFLGPIKEVLTGNDTNAYFAWLYGDWYDPERQWKTSSLVTAYRNKTGKSEPSFYCYGVGTGFTGFHPDMAFMDDPISEERIKEDGTWIATVNQSIAATRPALRNDSCFCLIGTRYRDNDPIGHFLRAEGIRSWSGMPCPDSRFEVKEDGEWDVYFLAARDSEGASILPEVDPTEELDSYENAFPREFASQKMNNPGVGEHVAITYAQIYGDDKGRGSMLVKREHVPRNIVISIHCDTAFKEKNFGGTGDESVIIVVGHDPRGNGDIYYLEGRGSPRWRGEEYYDNLVEMIRKYQKEGYRINCVTDEDIPQGGKGGTPRIAYESWMAGAGLRKIPPFLLFRRGGKNQEKRIRETFSYWIDGHVKLVDDAPGLRELTDQVIRFEVVEHKDRIDALSDAFMPEVYKRFRIETDNEGEAIWSPGDEVLKGRMPRTADETRQVYDVAHGEWLERWDPTEW
jgi:hypothetical protein